MDSRDTSYALRIHYFAFYDDGLHTKGIRQILGQCERVLETIFFCYLEECALI